VALFHSHKVSLVAINDARGAQEKQPARISQADSDCSSISVRARQRAALLMTEALLTTEPLSSCH